jgi:hypothetical protein
MFLLKETGTTEYIRPHSYIAAVNSRIDCCFSIDESR